MLAIETLYFGGILFACCRVILSIDVAFSKWEDDP